MAMVLTFLNLLVSVVRVDVGFVVPFLYPSIVEVQITFRYLGVEVLWESPRRES
jgi:hypothetical protein